MRYHVVTLFPNSLDSYLKTSIIGRAIRDKKIRVTALSPRDFAVGKHKKTDDRPYAGGPGLVQYALPILKAVSRVLLKTKNSKLKTKIIIFSPSGKKFTNGIAKKWAKEAGDLILISGRYEGIDARVKKILKVNLSVKASASVEEVSIGDYILTGGELPALVVIDAVSRQIPGVLGKFESVEENRVSSGETYTRPEVLEYKGKKYRVPRVLLTGNHKKIEEWKKSRNI